MLFAVTVVVKASIHRLILQSFLLGMAKSRMEGMGVVSRSFAAQFRFLLLQLVQEAL